MKRINERKEELSRMDLESGMDEEEEQQEMKKITIFPRLSDPKKVIDFQDRVKKNISWKAKKLTDSRILFVENETWKLDVFDLFDVRLSGRLPFSNFVMIVAMLGARLNDCLLDFVNAYSAVYMQYFGVKMRVRIIQEDLYDEGEEGEYEYDDNSDGDGEYYDENEVDDEEEEEGDDDDDNIEGEKKYEMRLLSKYVKYFAYLMNLSDFDVTCVLYEKRWLKKKNFSLEETKALFKGVLDNKTLKRIRKKYKELTSKHTDGQDYECINCTIL